MLRNVKFTVYKNFNLKIYICYFKHSNLKKYCLENISKRILKLNDNCDFRNYQNFGGNHKNRHFVQARES